MTPNQIYLLDSYRSKIQPSDIINHEAERAACIEKKLLTEDGKLTDRAVVVLNDFETFLAKTKKKVTSVTLGDDYLGKIKQYRELFPNRRLPSGSPAKQPVADLKDKFVWFFQRYPEFDWDLVLDATQYYIILKHREDYAYMSNSLYFIQKTDNLTKTSKSELATYCQLILDDPSVLAQI